VWMVAPCYYLASNIFHDSGLKVRGVGEGEGGIDLDVLEKGFQEVEEEESTVSGILSMKLVGN